MLDWGQMGPTVMSPLKLRYINKIELWGQTEMKKVISHIMMREIDFSIYRGTVPQWTQSTPGPPVQEPYPTPPNPVPTDQSLDLGPISRTQTTTTLFVRVYATCSGNWL
jgi:hypothetical protein